MITISTETKEKKPKEKKEKIKLNPKFKIKKYMYKNRRLLIVGFCSLLISVTLDMLSPRIVMHIVDDVIVGRDFSNVNFLLAGILLIGVGRFIFQYVKEYMFDSSSVDVAQHLRRDLFVHVESLDTSFFDKNNTGEIMARIKDDVDRIWDAVSYVSMLLIEVTVHTLIIMYCMVRLNPIITIIPVVAMVVCAILAIILEKKLDKVYDDISEENAVLNTTAEENIGGV
nr:ABC transporter ATP-binding protein [Lachnospiraceae bacterium]